MTGPLAGVALAAGRGERMRPLTDTLPKGLMPLADSTLLDLALDRLAAHVAGGSATSAVNAHYLADLVRERVALRATVSQEEPQALGTAGALGRLRPWLDGRDVLLTNADVYQPGDLGVLVDGWDGERCRLLVGDTLPGRRTDFWTSEGAPVRYVGSCLLPWSAVRDLEAAPSGLYEVLWRALDSRGELDLVRLAAGRMSIDCGTPADYLAANLHASGGASVIGVGAVVEGAVERCVVWPGGYVGPDETLREVVRAGSRERPLTVDARQVT
ncbi:sugar phosphate nucleotidyltransferase [Angustibacter sp. McL0619]|uniref:sugar phosphate nucleotidyltransferase n=1 Tax=Angustibacter sp. McL0619 TaxID=3415676 RepID=UPI003CF44F98